MAASKPSKRRKAKRASSLSGRKSKKTTSLGGAKAKRSRRKKPERREVGRHIILMASMFLFLALFSAYGSTDHAAAENAAAPAETTTTTTSTTSTSTSTTSTISTTTTTSTTSTTTTSLCGGKFQPPCEDGCNLGFIIGSTGNCHPKGPCAPSVSSGRDGCGSFALSFCAGSRI